MLKAMDTFVVVGKIYPINASTQVSYSIQL